MTLVMKGAHPKWTGGFAVAEYCRCLHLRPAHDGGSGECRDWYLTELEQRPAPCRCPAFEVLPPALHVREYPR